MHRRHVASRHRWARVVAAVAVLGLVAAACGGGGDDSGGGGGGEVSDAVVRNERPPDEGTPTPGGEVTYALEAETDGGFCPSSAQLAAGGIQVAGAIYDTLTAPDADGGYAPYLAESVTPNDTFTEWTVKLREGVTFHDGTPLNADAVKQNMDAYKGGLLFSFVFADLERVDVVDDLTVNMVTSVPWVAFDSYLWSTGRLGMAAPAQLADPETCPDNLIGTGPFKLVEWVKNDRLVTERNENYWRTDENGTQLPYLDGLTFRPQPDAAQRVNGLESGEYDLTHTTDGEQIDRLRGLTDDGSLSLLESDYQAETSYTMLNVDKPPFDNINARLAVAHAADIELINEIINNGLPTLSDQPFAPDNIAYQDPADLEFPRYDPAEAERYRELYEEEAGEPLAFTLSHTTDPGTTQLAELIKSQAAEVDIQVELESVDQATLINKALGSEFQANTWRNHPGGDPDAQYVWWYKESPVNFGNFVDDTIDTALREARSETDQDARIARYQEISQQFANEVYNIWGWYTLWAFGSQTNVHGVYPPALPDGGEPVIIASVQPVVGLWVES